MGWLIAGSAVVAAAAAWARVRTHDARWRDMSAGNERNER